MVTKDADFPNLLIRRGPPPQVIWLTIGDASAARLRAVLEARLPEVLSLLDAGEPLVEIKGD